MDSVADNGRVYTLTNIHELWPRKLDLPFIFAWKGGKRKYPKGTCSDNLPAATTTTSTKATTTAAATSASASVVTSGTPATLAPSTTSSTAQTTTVAPSTTTSGPWNIVPVKYGLPWSNNGKRYVEGVCTFVPNKYLNKFFVQIDVDEETYAMKVIYFPFQIMKEYRFLEFLR